MYCETQEVNKNESFDSKSDLSSSSNSYTSDQMQSSYSSLPNQATYNPYFHYYSQFNYPYYNYTNHYNSFQGINSNTMGYSSLDYQQVSPVSQSTSPNLQQQNALLTKNVAASTTPVNSNIKSAYSYLTPPPSESSTLNSTTSPKDIYNTSIISNEEDISKENIKPKEKNGRLVRRRNRVQFTQMQLDAMEAVFEKSHYPEVHVIDRLSDRLGVSIERLSIWFQNRRAKFKKSKRYN